MPPLLTDYLVLLWVLVSVLATGIAGCLRFTRLQGMELIGYGAGAGVLVHGLFGLLIAFDRHLRHYFGVLAICCAALALAIFFDSLHRSRAPGFSVAGRFAGRSVHFQEAHRERESPIHDGLAGGQSHPPYRHGVFPAEYFLREGASHNSEERS